MPRPKKPGDDGKEVKKRSRNGCWPCKARKVKCGEEKPACSTCIRQGETCDYSIRLNWDGRSRKKDAAPGMNIISFGGQPSSPPKTFPISPPASEPHNEQPTSTLGHSPQTGFVGLLRPVDVSPSHSRRASVEQTLPSITQFTQGIPAAMLTQTHATIPAPPVLRAPTWSDHGPRTQQPVLPPTLAPAPNMKLTAAMPYPSPAESTYNPASGNGFAFHAATNQMLPPMTSSAQLAHPDVSRSPFNSHKRIKLSPRHDLRESVLAPTRHPSDEPPRFSATPPVSFPPLFTSPMAPGASIASASSGEINDDRRISVSSLLSDHSDDRRPSSTTVTSAPSRRGSLYLTSISYNDADTYGHDRGQPDLDLPRNNDTLAISGSAPSDAGDFDSWLSSTDLGVPEFGFGLEAKSMTFAKGGYYASPVPIKIPRKLEPLPATLLENPMNLLYFHHFLNHTARVLVPHDCPENPFKTVLPKMAVENPHLLNLLLAYSACHRARLLGHPMPRNRIATWVHDLFPQLRHALQDTTDEHVSNANLATAIMLASLEIISPSSFDVSIPWHNHLSLARDIIRRRCGPHSVSRRDPVMYFLTRWLAYLDVVGSLSGRRDEEPLFAGNYWSSTVGTSGSTELSLTDDELDDNDDDYTIDCLLGFTTKCVSILAQVASLAHQCAKSRIVAATGEIDEAWRPSSDVFRKAEKLRKDLNNSRNHEQNNCLHHEAQQSRANLARHPSFGDITEKDTTESVAVNSAFHLAGLVHLLRRVHNLPTSDPQIQEAVHEIVKIVAAVREGGSAMASILFPMFTAGVEAQDPLDRAQILSRLKAAEDFGLVQVQRARKIVERVWETGAKWETLVSEDFFG